MLERSTRSGSPSSSSGRREGLYWLLILAVVLFWVAVGCTSVQLPAIKACATAGVITAGADCAWSDSGETEELNFDLWVDFLEPQPEKPGPNGTVIPAKGPAICISSEHWTRLKTAVEQLCAKVGAACTKETRAKMEELSFRIEKLRDRAIAKAKRPRRR